MPGHLARRIDDVDLGVDEYRVGMLIPMSGTAGIWGPSCLACATLATEEWNSAGGVRGRRVSLAVVDASDESDALEEQIEQLVSDGAVESMVGMHTSSVRQRIIGQLGGALPFVYTPLYEGGPLPDGVMAIGETPRHQLLPAIDWLTQRYRLRRWYLVGNDYCWPRRSHALAVGALTKAGCEVVGSRYVPMGSCDVEELIDDIRRTRAQAVLMSLVGQDAVDFSRAFGASGLAGQAIRLSCAIEENGLLAIGPEHTEGLFVASGYFGSLDTDSNGAFRERYWSRFGERAPVLNALGQSTYEGVAFLRGLLDHRQRGGAPVAFDSVRATRWRSNADKAMPIYLAQADGMRFRVIQALDAGG
ncbi:MAG: nitrile hydratase [Burkholderiales bacterium]|nr:MAG: nitrile hydratase [Burkholderiales bacterium]